MPNQPQARTHTQKEQKDWQSTWHGYTSQMQTSTITLTCLKSITATKVGELRKRMRHWQVQAKATWTEPPSLFGTFRLAPRRLACPPTPGYKNNTEHMLKQYSHYCYCHLQVTRKLSQRKLHVQLQLASVLQGSVRYWIYDHWPCIDVIVECVTTAQIVAKAKQLTH